MNVGSSEIWMPYKQSCTSSMRVTVNEYIFQFCIPRVHTDTVFIVDYFDVFEISGFIFDRRIETDGKRRIIYKFTIRNAKRYVDSSDYAVYRSSIIHKYRTVDGKRIAGRAVISQDSRRCSSAARIFGNVRILNANARTLPHLNGARRIVARRAVAYNVTALNIDGSKHMIVVSADGDRAAPVARRIAARNFTRTVGNDVAVCVYRRRAQNRVVVFVYNDVAMVVFIFHGTVGHFKMTVNQNDGTVSLSRAAAVDGVAVEIEIDACLNAVNTRYPKLTVRIITVCLSCSNRTVERAVYRVPVADEFEIFGCAVVRKRSLNGIRPTRSIVVTHNDAF